MKIPLTRSWIPLLLAALLFPGVVARGASDPSDTDPTVFGDGIFNQFNNHVELIPKIHCQVISTTVTNHIYFSAHLEFQHHK